MRTNGKPLWHSRIGNPSNAPQTYMVDGRQHVLVAVGDTLYAFALYSMLDSFQLPAFRAPEAGSWRLKTGSSFTPPPSASR